MFNQAKGYYKVTLQGIEVNRYYVLCLKNLRKPYLLRFSCQTAMLAKTYIMLKTDAKNHEVIKGDQALERGLKISKKKLLRTKYPVKYCYPISADTRKKRKQHRTRFRAELRKTFESVNTLKQFTIRYRGKTYTLFEYTILKAYNYLRRYTDMTWKHFITKVDNEPTIVTKEMLFIRTYKPNVAIINQFLTKHHGKHAVLKHFASFGKVANFESAYLSVQGPKPQRLIF